ncbi:hypothetical protein A7U60_g2905 [Sanghuangporus baumii]|uniref:Uncharacterized protein n=1 Tax=Sanghuangporus baumii TaxID=108892 RepID=A0A9Q5I1C2_SANBA|nr:hypothetical protein A7U60_g2905 [Sanghuangporus baumii]
MAITASAQSALQDLSWDEAIVPTLRKRLEHESRAISKRLSTISFAPGEDGTLQYTQKSPPRKSGVGNKAGGRVTPSSMNNERPSGIPRPSLNYSRPFIGSTNVGTSQADNQNDTKRPMQPRSRTYSQPFIADVAQATNGNRSNGYSNSSTTRTTNALPTPASSRSNSPVFSQSQALEERDVRSTKDTGNKRTCQNAQLLNRPLQTQNNYNTQERWDADEDTYDASYSSIVVDLSLNGKQNGILHEAPPFSANSSFVSEADERPSLEERPYEHWYRGDLSRNGGVGELRIGNRMEMLEIASYGHKLRGIRNDTMSRQRRRAESIGHRESVIFAEENENEAPMVLDETPLTDMEADTEAETDREQSFAHHTPSEQIPLEQPKRVETSTTETTIVVAVPATPKRRQPTQIPRTTPNAARTTQRTASEPLHSKSLSSSTSSMTPSSSRSPPNGTAARIPHSQSHGPASPAQKRGRAKSPAVAAPNKKPRPSAGTQKRSKSTGAAERLRVTEPSEYPEMPDGPGSMADAIPSWTQPKKAGNWDDVVLPVVARKMGLEDQYEEADGSPKAGRPSSEIVPPQPGTFGFDPSKRRQNYDPATGEEIPMEQFDRSDRIEEEKNGEEGVPIKSVDVNENRASKRFSQAPVNFGGNKFKQNSNRYEPPPSPAPFVQYQTPSFTKPEPGHELVIEEEKHGGCCGCTIM